MFGGANKKLTKQQALEIRSLYASGKFLQRELGLKFGVAATTVSAVVLGKSWHAIDNRGAGIDIDAITEATS